ncbi:hypothetical protein D0Z07_5815 [Hyphodiscus hymeniophilus]|uniref:Uncharacterized protein n=1 Tax=Hyphodiscus hymeniophilus TaxID=353542 RepID=A0A9P6VHM7_9HELO|nr:hypothetical protein D0Z07_5815 [Hyphodiscus hymeniophilus]
MSVPHLNDVPITSPTRPKHQVTRSRTEAAATFPKLHKSHPRHHPQLHRKDHREGMDKDPHSSHSNLQPQERTTKSEGVTPEESRAGSRRTSHDVPWLDRSGWEGELRNAILGLNTLSNNTTRRLDNTYYGVLEKLSVLQRTIMSMKELAIMTKQLNEEFKTESESVTRDVEVQLDGFAGFEDQQKRIGGLQERVMVGRDQIKTLGARVDVVNERVEGGGMAGENKEEIEDYVGDDGSCCGGSGCRVDEFSVFVYQNPGGYVKGRQYL